MNASQHTPGPWEARPIPDFKCIVIAEVNKMYPLAHITTATDAPGALTDREYANARLIASAPVLLNSLMLVEVQLSRSCAPDPDMQMAMLADVRAAIAKTI